MHTKIDSLSRVYLSKKVLEGMNWDIGDELLIIPSGTDKVILMKEQPELACPVCGELFTNEFRFCPYCGQLLGQLVKKEDDIDVKND